MSPVHPARPAPLPAGAEAEQTCPRCRAALPGRFRYCGMCGASLSPQALLPEAREQRRRAAILFADLSGSTAIADRLADESAFTLIRECLEALCRLVEEAGGYVVKTLGDGLMALFGAPVAHHDDAERAARAALALLDWAGDQAGRVSEQYGVVLQLRVGINFGTVVAAPFTVGERLQYDALGDAVNVARRLESAAEPGTTCVSEAFYRLTRQGFAYTDRGTALLKGKSEPIRLYRLDGVRDSDEQVQREFPLVGRGTEMAQIRERMTDLHYGRSAVIQVYGESGLGKSRILDETATELAAMGIPHLEGRGDAALRAVPYGLLRTWMSCLLPRDVTCPETAAGYLRRLAPDEAEDAYWLASLVTAGDRLEPLAPAARREVARRATRLFFQLFASGRPVAVLVDEAPLADVASLEALLAWAGEAAKEQPSLILLAGRELLSVAESQQLPLGGLDARDVTAWGEWALSTDLSPEEAEQLVRLTGGSPLYLERLFSLAQDAEDPRAALRAAPDSLFHLFQSELDQLSPAALEACHMGAVLGRSFTESWLADMLGEPETGPHSYLELERRRLLVEQRPPPHRELAFRHGALPEVVYGSMLSEERRQAHLRAASAIEREMRERPGLAASAAHHRRQAGDLPRALEWLLIAARQAAAVYSGRDAEDLFRQARDLAQECGDVLARARAEAGIAGLLAHRGEFTPALESYSASLALIERVPCPAETTAEVLIARGRALSQTGDAPAALRDLSRAAVLLAGSDGEHVKRLLTRCLTEEAHCRADLGQPAEAVELARRALSLAASDQLHREQAAAGSALGRAFTLLGRWREAELSLREAAALAEGCGDWQAAASSWLNLGAGLKSAGRLAEAAAAIQSGLRLAAETGDAEKLAIGRLNLGTVRLTQGAWAAAGEDFQTALADFGRMGHSLGVCAALLNLAETAFWQGLPGACRAHLQALDGARRQVEAPNLELHAELCAAELRLAAGELSCALTHGERARALADSLDYPSGRALSHLVLGRIHRAAGRPDEARQCLDTALAGFDASEEPVERSRAEGELAQVLAAAGDRRAAAGLRRRAVHRLRRLHAEPWLAHIPGAARGGA